jgi:hypothetical protein
VIYSPDLLRLMGTNIAADLLNKNHTSNEQKLWRHVIINAVEDARATPSDRKTSVYKFETLRLFVGGLIGTRRKLELSINVH